MGAVSQPHSMGEWQNKMILIILMMGAASQPHRMGGWHTGTLQGARNWHRARRRIQQRHLGESVRRYYITV